MKLQRGQETENGLWRPDGNRGQRFVFGACVATPPIDAAPDAFQLPGHEHARQHDSRDPNRIEITRPQKPDPPEQLVDSLVVGNWQHGAMMFLFFVTCN